MWPLTRPFALVVFLRRARSSRLSLAGSKNAGSRVLGSLSDSAQITVQVLTLFSEHSGPDALAISFIRSRDDAVQRASVVPHGHTADLPLPAYLMVVGGVYMVLEELLEVIYLVDQLLGMHSK